MENNSTHHKETPVLVEPNSLWQTWLFFVIFLALFSAGVFVFGYGTLDDVWPFAAGIFLIFIAFAIPMTYMGRTDSADDVEVATTSRKPQPEEH